MGKFQLESHENTIVDHFFFQIVFFLTHAHIHENSLSLLCFLRVFFSIFSLLSLVDVVVAWVFFIFFFTYFTTATTIKNRKNRTEDWMGKKLNACCCRRRTACNQHHITTLLTTIFFSKLFRLEIFSTSFFLYCVWSSFFIQFFFDIFHFTILPLCVYLVEWLACSSSSLSLLFFFFLHTHPHAHTLKRNKNSLSFFQFTRIEIYIYFVVVVVDFTVCFWRVTFFSLFTVCFVIASSVCAFLLWYWRRQRQLRRWRRRWQWWRRWKQ